MKMPEPGRQKTGFFAGWSRIFTYGVLQSLLAFTFYAVSALAMKSVFSWDYAMLIIVGTLGVYNSHLLIKSIIEDIKPLVFNLIFLLLLAIYALYLLINFNSGIEYLKHLLIPVIISILYLLPISKFLDSKFIPGWIKPVSLAISWTWICIGPIQNYDLFLAFFASSIFFLILSNALMFDVKDMEKDKQMNKSTFANKYGWRITQQIAFISLIISIITIGFFYRESDLGIFMAPMIIGLYFIPLRKIKTNAPQNQYYWYLDGGLFLFPAAVFLIQLISEKL